MPQPAQSFVFYISYYRLRHTALDIPEST